MDTKPKPLEPVLVVGETYEDILAQIEKEKTEAEAAAKESALLDNIAFDSVNPLLVEVQKKYYNINL